MIDQESLTISDEELEDGLKAMADSFNQPLEQIKNYYDQNKDKIDYFKHTLLEKKAIKLIIENSQIEDVDPEEAEAEGKETKPVAADD